MYTDKKLRLYRRSKHVERIHSSYFFFFNPFPTDYTFPPPNSAKRSVSDVSGIDPRCHIKINTKIIVVWENFCHTNLICFPIRCTPTKFTPILLKDPNRERVKQFIQGMKMFIESVANIIIVYTRTCVTEMHAHVLINTETLTNAQFWMIRTYSVDFARISLEWALDK